MVAERLAAPAPAVIMVRMPSLPQTYRADAAFVAGRIQADVAITVDASGDIAAVGGSAPADAARIAGIVVPGLPDLHSHAFQRAMAGLAERAGPEGDNFWSWRDVMYRFLGVLSPEDIEAIAAQLYVECLKQGFTTVGEFHYLHNDPSEIGRASCREECRSRGSREH